MNAAANGNNNVSIIIYTSEDMANLSVAIDNIAASSVTVVKDGSDKQWRATVRSAAVSALLQPNNVTYHGISINGQDISGNSIQGFANTELARVESDIKKRTSAIQFTPNTPSVVDTKHSLKIGSSMKSSNLTGCLFADFTTDKTAVIDDEQITLTSDYYGNVTEWHWVIEKEGVKEAEFFGKGPHTLGFSEAGNYDVSLTVSDGTAELTETKKNYIRVTKSQAYLAELDFTYYPATNKFTGISSADNISSWHWDFHDGTTKQGQIVTHSLSSVYVVYTVTLTITIDGNTKSKTQRIYHCGYSE